MESKRDPKISVTGTPGTGKTTLAKMLSQDLGLKLIDLNDLIGEIGIYETDPEGTRLVDPDDLRGLSGDIFSQSKGVIVEGHLSHLLPSEDITNVVVLRTHPETLRERLEGRDYPEEKIRDNLESEALDVILEEAIQEQGIQKIHEIDTTDTTPSECLETIKRALKGEIELKPGSVDWLEDYYGAEGP